VPNINARRLRSNKTKTIAGVIPDIMNPFYPAFERGIQDYTDQVGYDLIIYNTDGNAEKERKCLVSLLQGRVDGVIGVFFHLTARDLFPLLEQNIAVVRLESTPKDAGLQPLDNLFVDNVAAAKEGVSYLIQHGHARIAMITSHDGPARYRLAGYQQAMALHGVSIPEGFIEIGEFNEQGGYEAMQRLIGLGQQRPTAVFCANDYMAMGAMVAIREANLKIPQDFAILGFDDIETAKLTSPSLTTLSQSQRELGCAAGRLLFERIDGTAPTQGRSVQMPHLLVVRHSTG
jgi:LacI family transcriptional regulator